MARRSRRRTVRRAARAARRVYRRAKARAATWVKNFAKSRRRRRRRSAAAPASGGFAMDRRRSYTRRRSSRRNPFAKKRHSSRRYASRRGFSGKEVVKAVAAGTATLSLLPLGVNAAMDKLTENAKLTPNQRDLLNAGTQAAVGVGSGYLIAKKVDKTTGIAIAATSLAAALTVGIAVAIDVAKAKPSTQSKLSGGQQDVWNSQAA